MVKSWQKALGLFTRNDKTLLIPLEEIINTTHQTLTLSINAQRTIVYIKHNHMWKIYKKDTKSMRHNPTYQFYSNKLNQPTSTKPITVNEIDKYGDTITTSLPALNSTCQNVNDEILTIREY